jgi:chromosome partitioning protein
MNKNTKLNPIIPNQNNPHHLFENISGNFDGEYLLSMAGTASAVYDLMEQEISNNRDLFEAENDEHNKMFVSSKPSPRFSTSFVTAWLGVDRKRLNYLLTKDNNLPSGTRKDETKPQSSRTWSVKDVVKMYRQLSPKFTSSCIKPNGVRGRIITIGNFKGSTAKTSSAVTLAQGLALKGLKVLLADLDPKSNGTKLLGKNPTEIEDENTILPIFTDHLKTQKLAPIQTYFEGIDLIASNSSVQKVEMFIFGSIMEQKSNPNNVTTPFLELMKVALQELAMDYDVVIIDTPPQFSLKVVNALLAADGIICPVPPRPMDIASTVKFWVIVGNLINKIQKNNTGGNLDNELKTFDFIDILITMSKSRCKGSRHFSQWISKSYGEHILPMTVPDNDAIRNAMASNCTLLESDHPGIRQVYLNALPPIIDFIDHIDHQISSYWANYYQNNPHAMKDAEKIFKSIREGQSQPTSKI